MCYTFLPFRRYIMDLTLTSMLFRLALSILVGAVLGAERSTQNRAAGFRTHILVCMGSCIVMITNIFVFQVYDTGDPSRMAAQVISGVGFLGAGSIIVTKRNQIRGLTTAAGLWASACLGLTVGVGLYELAAVGCLAIFIVLRVLIYWDVHFKGRRNLDVYVELRPGTSFPSFLRALRDSGIHVADIQFEHKSETTAFVATLTGKEIAAKLESLDQISSYDEL